MNNPFDDLAVQIGGLGGDLRDVREELEFLHEKLDAIMAHFEIKLPEKETRHD